MYITKVPSETCVMKHQVFLKPKLYGRSWLLQMLQSWQRLCVNSIPIVLVTTPVIHASKMIQRTCIWAQQVGKLVGHYWRAASHFRLWLAAEEWHDGLFHDNACMAEFFHHKYQTACSMTGHTDNLNYPPHVMRAKLIQWEIIKAMDG